VVLNGEISHNGGMNYMPYEKKSIRSRQVQTEAPPDVPVMLEKLENSYEDSMVSCEESETEMESVVEVEVKQKARQQRHGGVSKIEMKKELMKRLTDEVESLKQEILKKNLLRVQKRDRTDEKVAKSSGYSGKRQPDEVVTGGKGRRSTRTSQYLSEG
jgi:hypothetical protein